MTVLAVEQGCILADTSPFCRFAESGICEVLADYLDKRLYLTPQVVAELEHRAKQAAHRALERLQEREPPWTPNPVVLLNDPEVKRADALAHGWRRQQEAATGVTRDERANLGEAS